MKFNKAYYFAEVVIVQSHQSIDNSLRMNYAKIFVVNSEDSTETLCGTLGISDEDQTYRITCTVQAYGDEIKVLVNHDQDSITIGCIHMKDIKAFEKPGWWNFRDDFKLNHDIHKHIFFSLCS